MSRDSHPVVIPGLISEKIDWLKIPYVVNQAPRFDREHDILHLLDCSLKIQDNHDSDAGILKFS